MGAVMHALPSVEVVRLPVRPRPRAVTETSGEVLATGGIRVENLRSFQGLGVLARPKKPGGLALDRLLENGTIDVHHYATAQAYAGLRRRYERSGGCRRSWQNRSGQAPFTSD